LVVLVVTVVTVVAVGCLVDVVGVKMTDTPIVVVARDKKLRFEFNRVHYR